MDVGIKVGEVYSLPVRVVSCNRNMDQVYFAVQPQGMAVPQMVLSPDGTQLLYIRAEQLQKYEG